MRDTIYRDEAIEICERWRQRAKEHHDRNGWYMADALLRFMKEMQSADRPQGEWICSDDSYENAVCSNCGFDSGESYVVVKHEQKWKACPMCDARMKGADDEVR